VRVGDRKSKRERERERERKREDDVMETDGDREKDLHV
jgi:hypothetical protein